MATGCTPEQSSDPQEGPLLNLDILRLVCDHLTDIPDVLSFALTCSTLTEDALRRRLRMAPIDLKNGKVVESFHAFIFSNERSRAPCIYGLKILGSYYGPQYLSESAFQTISDRLVAIVKAATHIQYVNVLTSDAVYDAVVDAVVTLTTVRELRILTDSYSPRVPLLAGLVAFQSPLRSLQIAGSRPTGGPISASFLHNCLGHLAPSLEFLDLSDFPIDVSASSVTTQFTAIRSLKFCTLSFSPDCDLLGVLVRLFPKLDNTLELGSLDGYIGEQDLPTFRVRCEEAQKRHSWPRLDRLVCNADIAYLLALHCPIRRMDIAVDFQDAGTRLFETLRHHCPPQLYVHISLCNDFRALDRMFPLEAADKLTHLVVFADIEIRHTRRSSRRNCDNTHSNRFVNRLLSAIRHLRLTHLRVVTNFAIYRPVRTAVLDTDSVGHIGLGDKMDFEVTKTRFVDAVPTLQYLFLTTRGRAHAIPSKKISSQSKIFTERWLTSKAWRVLHVNDENLDLWDSEVESGSCVELSREAAEGIIDRENLQLSSDEEDEVRRYGNPIEN